MTDENPKPKMDLRPSGSTYGSAVGGMVATIFILILEKFGIALDAVAAGSIGGGMAALFGWFFTGGKAADTED